MPEVFTALLCKGTSSKYANRLCVSNLNGDFMKYAPTDGEEKKKKGRGERNSALFIAVATRLIRKSPCHSPPASSSVPAIQINILLLQDPAFLEHLFRFVIPVNEQ